MIQIKSTIHSSGNGANVSQILRRNSRWRNFIVEVGNMMDAKKAGINDRFLPEKKLRAPLRGGFKTAQMDIIKDTTSKTHTEY